MASFERRGRAWRVKVRVAGVSESATFPTKAQAAAWAMEREASAKSGVPTKSLHQLLERYAEEISPSKRGSRWEIVRLEALKRDLADRPVVDLQPDDLGQWRDARIKGTIGRRPVAASTVNRELNLLATVLEHARREWKWVTVNVARDVRRPINPPARKRTMTDDERDRLLDALGYREDAPVATLMHETAVAMLLALETAMRSTEITGLTWDRVHLARRYVQLETTKNGDAREVPLSKRAVELIEKLKGRHKVKVFTVEPASRDALFRKAKERARVDGLTFHDTRATALTRLAKKLDVLSLAKMVGHRDTRSLMIYYRETAESIAQRLD
jgi:integrase